MGSKHRGVALPCKIIVCLQNSFLQTAQVIDLSKQQELTKAQELKTEEAKAQAAAQQYSIVRPDNTCTS